VGLGHTGGDLCPRREGSADSRTGSPALAPSDKPSSPAGPVSRCSHKCRRPWGHRMYGGIIGEPPSLPLACVQSIAQ
jgi:hypothetical protein